MSADIEMVRVAIDRLEGEGSDIEWCGFIDALARIEALLAAHEEVARAADGVCSATYVEGPEASVSVLADALASLRAAQEPAQEPTGTPNHRWSDRLRMDQPLSGFPSYDWAAQYQETAERLHADGDFTAADDIRTLVMGLQEHEIDLAAAEARAVRAEAALRDAEDTLRMYASGTHLIGLRHRIVDALALAGQEEKPE